MKLRAGAKKNYKEMDEGETFESNQSEGDCDVSGAHVVVNEECGNIDALDVEEQHENRDNKTVSDDANYDPSGESDDDEDLREAEARLRLLKSQQKRLQRQSKRTRIERETAEVENSLKELKKSVNQPISETKRVTSASLRAMDDVVADVDRLMDKNLSFRKSIDSASDSDVVSQRSTETRKTKFDEKVGNGKQITGKSKNSINSQVKFQQKWPHNFLNPSFVNGREKIYEDLSISEFVAGYATILGDEDCEIKRSFRSEHLIELMYLSTRFKWKNVLDYHGAVLEEIERGRLKWGSSFQLLQSTTLSGGLLVQNSCGGAGGSGGANRSNRNNEGIVFCKGYQRGICQQTRDHYGQFYGENRLMKHICAKCWLSSRTQANHPETSGECPLKEQ